MLPHTEARDRAADRRWSRRFSTLGSSTPVIPPASSTGTNGSSCCSTQTGRPLFPICSTRPRARYKKLDRPKPPAFLLYVDQGEELYVRAEERQRRRFSEVIAQGCRRSAPVHADEHAGGFSRRAAEGRTAI